MTIVSSGLCRSRGHTSSLHFETSAMRERRAFSTHPWVRRPRAGLTCSLESVPRCTCTCSSHEQRTRYCTDYLDGPVPRAQSRVASDAREGGWAGVRTARGRSGAVPDISEHQIADADAMVNFTNEYGYLWRSRYCRWNRTNGRMMRTGYLHGVLDHMTIYLDLDGVYSVFNKGFRSIYSD